MLCCQQRPVLFIDCLGVYITVARSTQIQLLIFRCPEQGFIYAVLSGSCSFRGWLQFVVLRSEEAQYCRASIAQLSVPVITSLGGVLLPSEPVTMQFVISSTIILVGISLVLVAPKLKQ